MTASTTDDMASIQKRIKAITDVSQRLDSAKALKENYANDLTEFYLLKVIYDCALKTGDVDSQAFALRHLCRCAYNYDNINEMHCQYYDSVYIYYEKLLSLNLKSKEYMHYLCDAKSFVCYTYINTGRFSTAMEVAKEILETDTKDDFGRTTGYEMLGQVYHSMFLNTNATESFKQAYNLSKKHDDQAQYSLHLNLLICDLLINTEVEEELLPFIEEGEKLNEISSKDNSYPMYFRNKTLYAAYRIAYYVKNGNAREAEKYVNLASDYIIENDPESQDIVNVLISRYYLAMGNPEKALSYVNRFDDYDFVQSTYLKQQVEVLKALNRHKEALEIEQEINNRLESNFNYMYSMQLNDLQKQFDVYNLKVQKSNRETTIAILIALFAIIIVLLLIYTNQRMLKAKKKIQRANATQKQFLQNMSHEIRTPLNAICGFSQLVTTPEMRDSISDEEMKQYGDIIRSNTDMLTTLVNDILDISDMNSGKYRLNFADCSVNEICKNAINTVSYRCPDHIKLYMTSEVDDNFLIHSDMQRSCQIIINYLTNAIKHTSEGEIHIHCSLSEHPGNITFSVTDTGEGVPANKAEVIFGRFEKLDTFKQGTGLGLPICRMLAELMHGKAKLDTSYTNGARFIFIHPLKDVKDETENIETTK